MGTVERVSEPTVIWSPWQREWAKRYIAVPEMPKSAYDCKSGARLRQELNLKGKPTLCLPNIAVILVAMSSGWERYRA